MAPLNNPGERLWRTDFRLGRNVYALLSNDVTKVSPTRSTRGRNGILRLGPECGRHT
jgi:hypothetical protein